MGNEFCSRLMVYDKTLCVYHLASDTVQVTLPYGHFTDRHICGAS